MKRYAVRYEYEMPGWDEFMKTAYTIEIVEANSPVEAKELFELRRQENTERNSLKFCLGVESVELLDNQSV